MELVSAIYPWVSLVSKTAIFAPLPFVSGSAADSDAAGSDAGTVLSSAGPAAVHATVISIVADSNAVRSFFLISNHLSWLYIIHCYTFI